MYVITVEFIVQPERAEAFRTSVLRQAANSLNLEQDCQRFDVAADPERPERIFLYEIYSDRAAFDLHLASDHFRDFDSRVQPWVESKKVEAWDLIVSD